MDTDDLTPMAYKVLDSAYGEKDALRNEIGVLAASYKNEEEFLQGVLEFVEAILEDPEDYLESWNLINEVDFYEFKQRLEKIKRHILSTIQLYT